MKAFILAAGEGKRLRPFTNNTPKPLFKIQDKALILWTIERLHKAGCTEIIINLSFLGEQIKSCLGDGSEFGVNISYSEEPELLGTGGGIGNALSILGEEPFILVSGDVWTDFNFSLLSLDSNMLAHMILIKNPVGRGKGDVYLEKGIVEERQFGEPLTFSGIAVISPSLFKDVKESKYALWEAVLRPPVLEGKVSGELYEGVVFNVNSIVEAEKLDALLSEE
jgi:MurNAc alpha-1-phosphate uridylyltransferase